LSNEELKELLKKAGLSKKAFSEILGTSNQALNNWATRGVPYWVESWLNLYIENKECKELKEIIRENVCKE
jgi:hypothetical protein